MNRRFFVIISIILISQISMADEWDIFDQLEEEEEQEDITYNEQLFLNLTGGYNWPQDDFVRQNDPANPYFAELELQLLNTLTVSTVFRFKSDITSFISSRGLEAEDQDLTRIYLAVNEFSLYVNIEDFLFIQAGILPISMGKSLIFNPVNILSDYMGTPGLPGAASFQALAVSFSFPVYTFGLYYLPHIPGATQGLPSLITDFLLCEKSNNSFLLFNQFFFWQTSLSVYLLAQETEAWSMQDFYTGVGTELVLPFFFDTIVIGQLAYSSTFKSWQVEDVTGYPGMYLLLPGQTETDNFFMRGLVSLNKTFFKVLDCTVGYKYNQSAPSYKDMNKISKSQRELKSLPIEDFMFPVFTENTLVTAHSISPFLQNLLFIHLAVPRFTEDVSISLLGLICPEDGSFQINPSLSIVLSSTWTMDVGAAILIAQPQSLFNLMYYDPQFYLGIKANF